MPHITPAHWHVILNHLPLVGVPAAALLVAWGLVRREEQVLRVALIAAVLAALSAWLTDYTGDGAKQDVRAQPWAQRDVIHTHEEAGDNAMIVSLVAGAAALGTLVLARRKKPVHRGAALGVLVLLLAASGFLTWAGWEGGKIRHTEFGLTPGAPPATQTAPGP
jgi:hypothetical protein